MSQWICSFFFVYSIDLTLNSVILQFKSIIEPLSEFCIIVMFNSKIATQFLRYLFLILMILMVIILHLHMASFCSLNMFVVPDLTSYLLKCDIWSSHRQFLSLFFYPLYRFTFLFGCMSFHFLLLKNAYFRKCILCISVGLIFLATKINQKSHSLVPVTGQNLKSLHRGWSSRCVFSHQGMTVVLAVWSLCYTACLWHSTDKLHSLPANCCFTLDQCPVHRVPYSFIQLNSGPLAGVVCEASIWGLLWLRGLAGGSC